MPWIQSLLLDQSYPKNILEATNNLKISDMHRLHIRWTTKPNNRNDAWRMISNFNIRMGLNSVVCWLRNFATPLFDPRCVRHKLWLPFVWKQPLCVHQPMHNAQLLGTKVNNMASRVKGLPCLWHHEHGRTYRSHDFSGGGRSRVLVSWRSTRDATSRRRVPWLATPCYLLSFPICLCILCQCTNYFFLTIVCTH